MSNDKYEEFDENFIHPIQDLADTSRNTTHDSHFTYSMSDIDSISDVLGIPWEKEKDQPFSPEVIFIGFTWNLETQRVSIPQSKRQKYLDAITKWQ